MIDAALHALAAALVLLAACCVFATGVAIVCGALRAYRDETQRSDQ